MKRRNCLLEREFLDVVLLAAPASEVDRRWSRRDRLARFVRPVSAMWLLDELSESRREPESPPVDPAKLRSFFRRLAVEAWRDGRACIDHVGGPVTSYCLDLPWRFPLWCEVGIGDGILVGSFQDTHLRRGSIWSPRGRPLIVVMAGELESRREDLYEEKLRTWIRDAPVARSGRTDVGDIRWALTASSEAERTRGDVGLVLLRNRRFVFLHCDSGGDIRYRELTRRAALEAAGVLELGDGADGVLDRVLALEPR